MSLGRLAFGVQVAVTAALLTPLFRKFDWALFQSTFSRTRPGYLAELGRDPIGSEMLGNRQRTEEMQKCAPGHWPGSLSRISG
jgi:hypothetical protein